MNDDDPAEQRAAVVLSCRDLAACHRFFAGLGFRLDATWPADDPRVVAMSGFGLCLRIERCERDGGGELLLPGEGEEQVAPNGARVRFATDPAAPPPALRPPLLPLIARAAAGNWTNGRAGMRYRELIPGRLGGALVASRIRIERGGPVDDYVHFHRVCAHVLHCRSGWARVAYEGQGEPLVLAGGDTVLQPPGIRHRVLECSDAFEAIEVAAPADHATCADHDLVLPSPRLDPARTFGGQSFVLHRASESIGPRTSIVATGIGAACAGAVDVRLLRPGTAQDGGMVLDETQLDGGGVGFLYVLRGQFTLRCKGETIALAEDDACVLPAGSASLEATWPHGKLLEVRVATTFSA